jgi:hypothetical protein
VAATLALSLLWGCSDAPTAPTSVRGGPTTDVDVAFCGGLEPEWVAFQEGDGAWTRALPVVAGRTVTFHHTFAADRGAVATARHFSNGLTVLSVQYGTPAELAIVGDTVPFHCGPADSRTLLGAVAGLDATDIVSVSAGHGSRAFLAGTDEPDFALRALVPGPQEILATRATQASGGSAPFGIILRRLPELPDSATTATLDFASAEAFAPLVRNVTIDGLGVHGAIGTTSLRTAHSDNVVTFLGGDPTAATRPYFAIPEARLEAGELQSLTITAAPSPGEVIRSSTVYFRSPVDRTVTLGPTVLPPTLGVASSTPTLRPTARFAPQAEYDRLAVIAFEQGQGTVVTVGMTAAYAALHGGTYDIVVPELTTVEGFDPRWALHAGAPVGWTANRAGGTLGLGQNAVPADGSTSRVAVVSGAFTAR